MVELGAIMHKETLFASLDYDPDKLTNLCETAVASNHSIMNVFIAVDDDVLVGMMGGTCFEHFFGNDKLAMEMFLYIHPDYRGGTASVRLIKKFEQWAESQGAVAVQVGVSTGLHPERTGRLYKALGFEEIGPILKKGLNNGRKSLNATTT
jgi:GNAT superfamily N-acetyltransferase